MNRFEQIDSFSYEIESAIDVADTKLKKCNDVEAGNTIISEFVSLINSHITRYNIEFDLTTYDIIGAIEMVKYDFAVNDTIAPEILGGIEFAKIALLADTNVIFESEEEIDIEDLEDDDFTDY